MVVTPQLANAIFLFSGRSREVNTAYECTAINA